MKSEPVRSAVRISVSGSTAVSAVADMIGVAGAGARAAGACASTPTSGTAIAAAPASDARFRKPRRFIKLLTKAAGAATNSRAVGIVRGVRLQPDLVTIVRGVRLQPDLVTIVRGVRLQPDLARL